jgi:2-methylisocitrate lyase-like PEP mutase family enzyme
LVGRGGEPASEIGAAIERAQAYAAAGASGFFIPGLKDATLIGRIVDGVSLPVNVMMSDGVPSRSELADLGVARISYGPIPYREAMRVLEATATRILS